GRGGGGRGLARGVGGRPGRRGGEGRPPRLSPRVSPRERRVVVAAGPPRRCPAWSEAAAGFFPSCVPFAKPLVTVPCHYLCGRVLIAHLFSRCSRFPNACSGRSSGEARRGESPR